MKGPRTYSPLTVEAGRLLGSRIRLARKERPRCPACGSKAKRAKDYNYERIYRCPARRCRIWIKED